MDSNETIEAEAQPLQHGIRLHAKIQSRTVRIGVIGLGSSGISLAIAMARKGYRVRGIDLDAQRVNAVNAGTAADTDVDGDTLLRLVRKGKIKATQALAAVAELDILIVCVPTYLARTREPENSYLMAATEAIRNHLRPGQLVVLETNTYPGMTRQLVLPILEQTGLQVGKEFFLACSPERIDSSQRSYKSRSIPKIIGGITPQCTKVSAQFFSSFVGLVVAVSSPEAAEMIMFFENTFRSVNTALANEMAVFSRKLGVNIWEVIEAAKAGWNEAMASYPCMGVGKHYIPHYQRSNAQLSGFRPRLLELALDINEGTPARIIESIAEALNAREKSLKGASILVLGIACKRHTGDRSGSTATEVMLGLRQRGARVSYSDPYITSLELDGESLASVELTPAILQALDCVVLLIDHAEFAYEKIAAHSALIVDTHNGFKNCQGPQMIRL